MSGPMDYKKLAKEKKKDDIKKAAYARKINNQYEFLKKWDKGEITGMECCEGIEQEGKIFRIENDLTTPKPLPQLPQPPEPRAT
jgi:hypothetical protein